MGVQFLDTNNYGSIPKVRPEILAGINICKKWLSAYKFSNISEMGQDRTKVTIEVLLFLK